VLSRPFDCGGVEAIVGARGGWEKTISWRRLEAVRKAQCE
jgi:hypothetical protein